MRVAIIADIHANLSLKSLIAIEREGIDRIICPGTLRLWSDPLGYLPPAGSRSLSALGNHIRLL